MRTRRPLAFLILMTLAGAGPLAYARYANAHQPMCSGLEMPGPRESPLDGPHNVTLAYARANAGYRISTPRLRTANDADIHHVWFFETTLDDRAATPENIVGIDYDSGVTISYRPADPEDIAHPGRSYRKIAAAYDLDVVDIEGHPAVVNPSAGPCWSRATLTTVVGHVDVEIVIEYEPAFPFGGEDLLEDVAASIIARAG